MEDKSDLLQVLVTTRQEDLRRKATSQAPHGEPGRLRRMVGGRLVQLGERVGGAPRATAPVALPPRLASRG
jgi:hypothetical protein